MVSPEASRSIDLSSPRISFSADFLDENDFISISPHSHRVHEDPDKARNPDFEFLSSNDSASANNPMITADQLFFEGKLLPFWQVQHSDRLSKINLKTKDEEAVAASSVNKEEMGMGMGRVSNVNWFVDDDPSPRPPKCTVLWKELLRLKKQRNASSLSPSSSSSSTSSSSSSMADAMDEKNKEGGLWSKEKHVKRIKKGLERTRSASIRIRPMINVPICTHMKSSSLPPLFPLRKARISERTHNN